MGQPWSGCGAATSCLVWHRVGGRGDRDKHCLGEHVWGKKPMGGTSLGRGDTANVSEVRAPPFRCYNLYFYIYICLYIYIYMCLFIQGHAQPPVRGHHPPPGPGPRRPRSHSQQQTSSFRLNLPTKKYPERGPGAPSRPRHGPAIQCRCQSMSQLPHSRSPSSLLPAMSGEGP